VYLDVSENGNFVIQTKLLPVSKETSSAGVHQAFIGNVAEHETLGPDVLKVYPNLQVYHIFWMFNTPILA